MREIERLSREHLARDIDTFILVRRNSIQEPKYAGESYKSITLSSMIFSVAFHPLPLPLLALCSKTLRQNAALDFDQEYRKRLLLFAGQGSEQHATHPVLARALPLVAGDSETELG